VIISSVVIFYDFDSAFSKWLAYNVHTLCAVASFGTAYFLLKIVFLVKEIHLLKTILAILPSIYVKAVALSIRKIIIISLTL